MNSELRDRKVGKRFILKTSIVAILAVTLVGCTKEELRIKPISSSDKNHSEIDDVPTSDSMPCGNFRTQTQGGWGSTPHGNNPGKYVHNNFAGAFPNGLTVGCTYKITLTSAQAITDYLPAGGTPAVLTTNYTNPNGLKNNLASQLVALTLSVQFDLYDPAFSGSSTLLGNLIIGAGTFKGMTINNLLSEANKVLGGCPSKYSATEISDVLSSINENFVDGTKNGGFLVCPGGIGID
jgi:hypothetical protein